MTLTRTQVETAALDLLVRFGLSDLSMRRLARELDVQVGALYWHVKNKQELLVGVAGLLLSEVPVPDVPDDAPLARGELLELSTALRSTLEPVMDSAEVIHVAQSLRPSSLPAVDRLAGLAEAAGVPRERASWAQHLLLNHILGSVATAHESRRLAAAEPDAPATQVPQEAFRWGVEVILAGLADQPSRPPDSVR